MLPFVAALVLWATAGYFAWFSIMVWRRPQVMQQYLLAFASNRRLHLLELGLRLLIAASCWQVSDRFPAGFLQMLLVIFAVILWVTSLVLLLMPWQWHRTFTAKAVPKALPFLPWLGVVSALLALGLVMLLTVLLPT